MLKNNLKKLLLVYIIIIAGILICQLCYRAYTNFQINANHKKVEEILEHRLKFSWEEREERKFQSVGWNERRWYYRHGRRKDISCK